MEKQEVLIEIEGIIQSVLDRPSVKIDEMTVPYDIDGWDSVTHISLISTIENMHGLKFSLRESMSWETMGDLVEIIQGKLNA